VSTELAALPYGPRATTLPAAARGKLDDLKAWKRQQLPQHMGAHAHFAAQSLSSVRFQVGVVVEDLFSCAHTGCCISKAGFAGALFARSLLLMDSLICLESPLRSLSAAKSGRGGGRVGASANRGDVATLRPKDRPAAAALLMTEDNLCKIVGCRDLPMPKPVLTGERCSLNRRWRRMTRSVAHSNDLWDIFNATEFGANEATDREVGTRETHEQTAHIALP
jgi:hypothetical protein